LRDRHEKEGKKTKDKTHDLESSEGIMKVFDGFYISGGKETYQTIGKQDQEPQQNVGPSQPVAGVLEMRRRPLIDPGPDGDPQKDREQHNAEGIAGRTDDEDE
jgi:hypothetical protein